jgi:hypothetical protein
MEPAPIRGLHLRGLRSYSDQQVYARLECDAAKASLYPRLKYERFETGISHADAKSFLLVVPYADLVSAGWLHVLHQRVRDVFCH